MARAVSFPSLRTISSTRARFACDVHLFLDMLPPALLLALLRTWATELAPRQGVYFTAEALLIVYAYFALIRSVYVTTHGRDRAGAYDRTLAQEASRVFHSGLRPYATRIAILALSLLLGALALDTLTAGAGVQQRPNVHLAILFVGVAAWLRYGAAINIATARWMPDERPRFDHARELASQIPIATSFLAANLIFALVAVVTLAPFKFGAIVLPSRYDQMIWSAGLFTGLALLALWLQCRWTIRALAIIRETDTSSEAAPEPMRHAA